MTYRVEFTPRARRDYEALEKPLRQRILVALDGLRADPFAAPNVKAMVGGDTYRLRVGDYRIIFRIVAGELVVLIIKVGHRREVYR